MRRSAKVNALPPNPLHVTYHSYSRIKVALMTAADLSDDEPGDRSGSMTRPLILAGVILPLLQDQCCELQIQRRVNVHRGLVVHNESARVAP